MLVARDTEKEGMIRKGIEALGLCGERVNPRLKVSRGTHRPWACAVQGRSPSLHVATKHLSCSLSESKCTEGIQGLLRVPWPARRSNQSTLKEVRLKAGEGDHRG